MRWPKNQNVVRPAEWTLSWMLLSAALDLFHHAMPEERIRVQDITLPGTDIATRSWSKFRLALHPIGGVREDGGHCICRLREGFGGEIVGDRLCRANKGAVNFDPYFVLKKDLPAFVKLF
jgi:hypothetical protein